MRNTTGTGGTGISLSILHYTQHTFSAVKKRKVNARATRATPARHFMKTTKANPAKVAIKLNNNTNNDHETTLHNSQNRHH